MAWHWAVLAGGKPGCSVAVRLAGTLPLEPAQWSWLPAECRTLGWGAGSAPCQLQACCSLFGEGSQHSLLNRLGCTLLLPLAPCLAWGHNQQPHYVPAVWATCQGTWHKMLQCSIPTGWGQCVGRSVPTPCVYPPQDT